MRKAVFVLLLVMGSLVGYSQDAGKYTIVTVKMAVVGMGAEPVQIEIVSGGKTDEFSIGSAKFPYYGASVEINQKLVEVFNNLDKEGYKLINTNTAASGSFVLTNYVFYKQ